MPKGVYDRSRAKRQELRPEPPPDDQWERIFPYARALQPMVYVSASKCSLSAGALQLAGWKAGQRIIVERRGTRVRLRAACDDEAGVIVPLTEQSRSRGCCFGARLLAHRLDELGLDRPWKAVLTKDGAGLTGDFEPGLPRPIKSLKSRLRELYGGDA